ncbi:MAG TPA: pyridoxal 5'-phosphate synthase [Candidatus Ruania gallistercoris]|uniref:Pyridoxal 5'-phosphate synthase n=1 Tax=Candidatus Ruania gallistercoris TaxID=2838746 RepID=A0A9D2EHV1_9MICO|nr:pyridoxal 5'-phosphate synthase [Candidatus Ruania gallistercoris]
MTAEPNLRQWLRDLPVFDRDRLPEFDPEAVPATPAELYLDWLRTAVDAGVQAPHAMVLSTAGTDGRVTARTLILKDVDADTWCVATSAHSPKAAQLAENPAAALTTFWGPLGRQIRITGEMSDLGDAAGAADFHARPPGSRAAALVGRQSEELTDRQAYWDAFAAALETVQADPGIELPSWRAYGLRAESVEFWQATPDAGQIRLRYRRTGTDWDKELLWP